MSTVSGTLVLQRPEKYLGDLETWEKAEASLSEALNEFGKDWQVMSYLSFHVLITLLLHKDISWGATFI